MISIFNGRARQLGEEGKSSIFVQFSVELRDHLHKFKDSQWIVFCAIALHADADGLAFPSMETLKRETGLGRDTISRAVTGLCALEIDGKRVMLAYQAQDKENKAFKSNRYLVFPSATDLARYDGKRSKISTDAPCMPEPYTGEPYTAQPNTDEAYTKKNHTKEETREIACAAPQAPSFVVTESVKPTKIISHPNTAMLMRVCHIDLATATANTKHQLFQSARIIIKEGYTEQDIHDAGMRWFTSDWRSGYKTRAMRDRTPPTPAQLREVLGQMRAAKAAAALAPDALAERRAEGERAVAKVEEQAARPKISAEEQAALFASFYTLA